MTPEAQRSAIAQACPSLMLRATDTGHWLFKRNGRFVECDPLDDLNAMHEAEKFVDRIKYFRAVEDVVEKQNDYKVIAFAVGDATAPQRAEAFLRTLGKWDDSK